MPGQHKSKKRKVLPPVAPPTRVLRSSVATQSTRVLRSSVATQSTRVLRSSAATQSSHKRTKSLPQVKTSSAGRRNRNLPTHLTRKPIEHSTTLRTRSTKLSLNRVEGDEQDADDEDENEDDEDDEDEDVEGGEDEDVEGDEQDEDDEDDEDKDEDVEDVDMEGEGQDADDEDEDVEGDEQDEDDEDDEDKDEDGEDVGMEGEEQDADDEDEDVEGDEQGEDEDPEKEALERRWIMARAHFANYWLLRPALPSRASRVDWAQEHGIPESNVHGWFKRKRVEQRQKGTYRHPQDDYILPLELPRPPEGDPAKAANMRWNVARARLTISYRTTPAIPSIASRRTWAEAEGVPSDRVNSWFKYRQVNRGGETHEDDEYTLVWEPLEEQQSSSTSVDPVAPLDNLPGPSTQPVQAPQSQQAVSEENLGPQDSVPDADTSIIGFPLPPPSEFGTVPQSPYAGPTMDFGTGGARNPPPELFGTIRFNPFNGEPLSPGSSSVMVYNPFTGARLLNNTPPEFSFFNDQLDQPAFENLGGGPFGQMNGGIPGPSASGLSSNVRGNTPTNQNPFVGNFQGFQPDMSPNGGMNLQDQSESAMSMLDFLHEPLPDA